MGLALRLGFVALEPPTSPIADETMWLMALQRIPAAQFSPFANYPIFHPPLYPYFLAALHAIFGSLLAIKVAQAVIGALLIPAVHRVAVRLFGARPGMLAAVFVAVYPELIWYCAHFWCETLFLTILWWGIERALAADASGRFRDATWAGLLFGFAILTRETLLYLVPVVALWLWFRPSRDRVLPLALVLTTFAVVAPWTARNAIQFGAFIPVSTGGGLNLYQGNAEVSRDQVYREYYINEGKVEQFEWARTAGLKAIWKRQPGWIFEKIRDEGPRLAELDSLALIHLRRGAYESVSCAAYRGVAAVVLLPWLLVAFGAVIGLARMRLDRAAVLLILVAAAYLFLHIATHGFSRYRLPMVPVFVILAASVLGNTGAPPTTRRRLLLGVLTAVLVLLLTPSAMDQAGFLGLAAPPEFEGFPPICPR